MLSGPQVGCISFRFYIKPQRAPGLRNPLPGCISFRFYIKPQQGSHFYPFGRRCISFRFYIKPQLDWRRIACISVVSHSVSTSNHNHWERDLMRLLVVSHSVSTSNHNLILLMLSILLLYLIPFLHQTTTTENVYKLNGRLYLIPFLHQTTTSCIERITLFQLYLIPFLHQTTTSGYTCYT